MCRVGLRINSVGESRDSFSADTMLIMKKHIVTIAIFFVFFTGLFNHELWSPDEPRVAAISLEMSKTGDIVVPRLGGVPFVEKPPLYFAMGALFIKAFGNMFGATNSLRLVTALFGILTVLMNFLLAKRLYGSSSATLSAAILATMIGFVINFHWIRVDAALCFFVIAAIWSFSEVYMGDKPWMCLGAGLFSAGAFLTKGLIGPVLIGIPWFCMFILWMAEKRKTGCTKPGFYVVRHILGLMVFMCISGLWIHLLRKIGGPDLWHEWFWDNHVGRFTGESISLGHLHPGRPMYYINQLAIDSMPWFPFILLWLWGFFRNIFQKNRPSKSDLFLFAWGAGSILLLSISITKRNVYLVPIYPAFAIAASQAATKMIENKILKKFYYFWGFMALAVLAVISILPFLSQYSDTRLKDTTIRYISTFGFGNILAIAGFLMCGYMLLGRRKKGMETSRIILLTCIFYICLLSLPLKVIDHEKNFQPGLVDFVNQIPPNHRSSVVAFKFSETDTACFSYYADWLLSHTENEEQVKKIVAGKDNRYKEVLFSSKLPFSRAKESFDQLLTGIPYKIMSYGYMGAKGKERGLFRIVGDKDEK